MIVIAERNKKIVQKCYLYIIKNIIWFLSWISHSLKVRFMHFHTRPWQIRETYRQRGGTGREQLEIYFCNVQFSTRFAEQMLWDVRCLRKGREEGKEENILRKVTVKKDQETLLETVRAHERVKPLLTLRNSLDEIIIICKVETRENPVIRKRAMLKGPFPRTWTRTALFHVRRFSARRRSTRDANIGPRCKWSWHSAKRSVDVRYPCD